MTLLHFHELDTNIKKSFKLSVRNTMHDIINETNYKQVDDSSVVDTTFVNLVVEGLEERKSFQKWGEIPFEIADEDMKTLIHETEVKMRKKKTTDKQKEYYTDLVDQLQLEEEVPTDYFLFQKRLNEMKKMLEETTPATPKQIETIKKLWEKIFKEELELKDNVSKKEISMYFEIVDNVIVKNI